jgi:multicomponent Na+:H+ antiporter subunit E
MRLRVLPGRLLAIAGLALWSVVAVVRASTQVARDIVAPSPRIAPVVLVLPLRTRTAVEAATVSGLFTLTPGTLTVGLVGDPPAIWVHGMYGSDPEALRAGLRSMETRVLRALRHPEPVEDSR